MKLINKRSVILIIAILMMLIANFVYAANNPNWPKMTTKNNPGENTYTGR